MYKFNIGDKVVTLKNLHNASIDIPKGSVKTITFRFKCQCGHELYGIGLEVETGNATCRTGCKKSLPFGYLVPYEFLALTDRLRREHIFEITCTLPQEVKEVPDVQPVKI